MKLDQTRLAPVSRRHLRRISIDSARSRRFRNKRTHLERGGEEDGERAGADDADDGERGELEVALVLVAVRLELFRRVDGGVLVDVRLAVAEAELVDVAGLAIAADERRGKKMRLKVSERRSRGGRNGDRIDAREAPRSRDDRGSRRARRAMGTRPRETVERESRRPRTCGSSGVCGGPGHPRFAGKTEFATPRRGEVRGRRARCRNRPRPREVLGFFRGSDRERGRGNSRLGRGAGLGGAPVANAGLAALSLGAL